MADLSRAEQNAAIAAEPAVKRYLDMIAAAEGADYNTLFGGGKFEDTSRHPGVSKEFTQTDGKKNRSTAAGRYQFLQRTWDDVAKATGVTDFSPRSQDIGAVELLRRSGSLEAVRAGRYEEAVSKDNKTWASLPGSPYAQRTRSMDFVRQHLGVAAAPAMPQEGPKSAPGDANEWPRLPTSTPEPKNAPAASAVAGLALTALAERGTFEQSQAETQRSYDEAVAIQAERDATGFSDVFQATRRDPRAQALFTLLNKFNEQPEPPIPEGWDLAAELRKASAGRTDEAVAYLYENVRGPQSLSSALAELDYRAELDKTYGNAGGWASFAGQMAGGLMDPVGFAAGVGVGKMLQLAGLGSRALIAAGRPGAAVASLAAEGALGNVAVEGIQDYLGEVKTSSDYAMAAAMGVIFTLPMVRGTYLGAANEAALRAATDLKARAVNEQIEAGVRKQGELGTAEPVAVARAVEADETAKITEAVRSAQEPQVIRDPVIPKEIADEQRRQFNGEPEPATPEPKPVKPEVPEGQEAPEPLPPIADVAPEKPEKLVDLEKEDPAQGNSRDIPTRDGGFVRLTWERQPKPEGATYYSVREVLQGIIDLDEVPKPIRAVADYLSKALRDDVQDVGVRFRQPHDVDPVTGKETPRPRTMGRFRALTSEVEASSKLPEHAALEDHLIFMDPRHLETVLHETIHAATMSKIQAYANGRLSSSTDAWKAAKDLDDLYKQFLEHWKSEKPKYQFSPNTTGLLDYAAKNLHEFAAMAITNPELRAMLREMPGKSLGGIQTTAWQTFINALTRLFGKGDNAFRQAAATLDRLIAADGSMIRFQDGSPTLYSPDFSDAEAPALFNGQAQRRHAQQMYQHAEQWVARNPVDPARLKVLTNFVKKYGGLSDGLVLAQSKNPIAQMVAGLVTEVTTGAAGRHANAAIRAHMLHRKMIGNAMLDYTNAFSAWGKQNGGTFWDSVFHGEKRREFDRAVMTEMLNRRDANYTPSGDGNVRMAADSLEKLFDRTRTEQVQAGTLGSERLGDTSRGYVPQALDGTKYIALSAQEQAAFHAELAAQFQERLGWDQAFAETFAPYYVELARARAQKTKGVDSVSAGDNSVSLIRATLDTMSIDPQTRDRLMASLTTRGGTKNTKSRLDLDLRREFAPGRRLLDVYVNDPLLLARQQARQTAGAVALTEQGILGIRGVQALRDAMAQPGPDGTRVTQQELDAFDRVTAEILGHPIPDQITAPGASTLQLLVGLQRLGGLAFTQAAEMYNMIHILGLRSTLAGIPNLPRLMGEVGRLKRGQSTNNSILGSIEAYGGEFGAENYKMVAPLDPPESRLEDYAKQAGLVTRLSRAGVHLQSKVSLFRGIMAVQHRHAAEQITMKAMRYIRDGGDDIALRDMGFTPDVVAAIKADLPRIAQWDSAGRLQALDLSAVTDVRAAEAFAQAVNRGTSQIIQGTFIGEQSKWMHNDYLRVLLQLRTFGLTATEKQLGRTAMNHGYAGLAGAIIAQTALALPLHMARVHAAALGREDRKEYLENNMNPMALARAVMNYSSVTGFTGDALELMGAIAGGWMDTEGQELLGVKNSQMATSVGRLVPALGSIDSALKAVSGKSDLHTVIKQLPFSNLPYLLPLINLTKSED